MFSIYLLQLFILFIYLFLQPPPCNDYFLNYNNRQAQM